MPLLLIFACVFIFYVLQERLYRSFWGKGLNAQISFSTDAVTEGDTCTLSEVVENRKFLPLPSLAVKFQTSRKLIFPDMEDAAMTDLFYKNDLFTLMPYERITRNLTVHCASRGYFTIRQMEAVSCNLFYQGIYASSFPMDTEFYVYPAPAPVHAMELPLQKLMGEYLVNRFMQEDPYEFKGIRPYEPYDGMKKINWKASAREGKLMVNQYYDTIQPEVLILLNLEPEGVWVHHDLLEASIRIACSYMIYLIQKGVPVRLLSNGRDIETHAPVIIENGGGRDHIVHCRKMFARIDLDQKAQPFPEMLAGCQEGSNTLVLLISYSQKNTVSEVLQNTFSRCRYLQWIVPVHKNTEHTVSLPGCRVFYEEIEA